MRCDFHVHTSFSADCSVSPETMLETALQKKLDILCITDHQDFDFPYKDSGLSFDLDLDVYEEKIHALQAEYNDKIDLRFGVELGLEPHLTKELTDFASAKPFDFIIGSIHLVHRVDPWYPEYFAGRKDTEAFEEYFEDVLTNIQSFHNFDVLGHLDYIIRYAPHKNKNYSYAAFQDIIDAILKELIHRGIGLELNTGSIKSGLDAPNPCREALVRYRELGGEIITLGSDAHKTEYLAYQLDEMQKLLLDCGFRYFTVFKDRKPEMLPLSP